MSEAWRGFCHPGTILFLFYERRAAPLRAKRVTGVQVLLRAGHKSPYMGLIESSGAVTVMYPYTVFS
jgi:hypothetical protein